MNTSSLLLGAALVAACWLISRVLPTRPRVPKLRDGIRPLRHPRHFDLSGPQLEYGENRIPKGPPPKP